MRTDRTLEIQLAVAQKKRMMYMHDMTTVHHEQKRRNLMRSRNESFSHLLELASANR